MVFRELVLSLHYVGSGDQTQAMSLGESLSTEPPQKSTCTDNKCPLLSGRTELTIGLAGAVYFSFIFKHVDVRVTSVTH